MAPKDKYTVFSRHDRGYRKGIHKMPKFTRVGSAPAQTHFEALMFHSSQITQRVNPKGF